MRVELDLDGADPPTGHVTAGGTPPVPFTGWLGLLSVLRGLAGATPARQADAGTVEPPPAVPPGCALP
jgi:hypothetical protein